MKPVLIAGGAGYIGSHTVQELTREGIPVVVLDNLSTGHREAVDVQDFYQGDIADTSLVEYIVNKHKIQSLIHFAARSQVGESLIKPELYFDENTVKSFLFFETAMKAGVRHFVFSSTAAVYGMHESMPLREENQTVPINPYGASKLMIEEYLRWMGRVHDIGWIALRYFNASGASLQGDIGEDHHPETHLIPLVMQTAMGIRKRISVFGNDYPTADGTCMRDYIHVRDLARAHILALWSLESGLSNRIFNVGTGRGFSVMEIIERSRVLSGAAIDVDYDERRPGDPAVLVADSSAIKRVLGWEPRYSDLDTILSSAWAWHSTHPRGFESGNAGLHQASLQPLQLQMPVS